MLDHICIPNFPQSAVNHANHDHHISIIMLHFARLLRDRRGEDLCPEESSLSSLDNLLVNAAWWVVHDNCALLVVDLGINASVADKVDNPLLTLVLIETETGGEVLDVDTLVDLAVRLGDEVTGRLDERVGGGDKEEVGAENLLSLDELLLGLLEVKIDVKGLDEIGDWVAVLVVLLLDDADDILKLLLVLAGVASAGEIGRAHV